LRLVDLESISPGVKLAKPIYSSDGHTLLGKGMSLNPEYIKRLQVLGITSVYIEDEILAQLGIAIENSDLISETARKEAVQVTRKCLEDLIRSKPLETKKINQVVNNILDELLKQDQLVVTLTDIRTFDDYIFNHSANVAVLSLIMGISLGYDQIKLRNLGIGALLHDIGKTTIPLAILNKPGKLTEQELSLVQQHSQTGFEIMRENQELSIITAHVAYQHHEKFDGTGYPRGLKGKEISEFARIAALADVYDALTANRSYRKGYLPHEAYEYLMASGNTHFDYDLIQLFSKHISPYPTGTIVRLNTGEKAVVTKQNLECLLRPTVLVFEEKETKIVEISEYNLTDHHTIMVQEVIR